MSRSRGRGRRPAEGRAAIVERGHVRRAGARPFVATGIRAERGAALRRFDAALSYEYDRAMAPYCVAAQRAPGSDPGRVRWFCRFCPLTVRLCVSCHVERIAEHRAAEARFDCYLAEISGHADSELRVEG